MRNCWLYFMHILGLGINRVEKIKSRNIFIDEMYTCCARWPNKRDESTDL